MTDDLAEFVRLFAVALNAVDSRRPRWKSYEPGIGPHEEDRAVDLIVDELNVLRPDWRIALRHCYPGSKQKCDLLWGDPPRWATEIKMWRPNHNTGVPDPTAVKDVLS